MQPIGQSAPTQKEPDGAAGADGAATIFALDGRP
jgi:hypothetical protein